MTHNVRRLVMIALLTSMALVLSIIEWWIPAPVPIPGIKLGLSNVITIVAIVFLGYKESLLIVFLRTLLSSFYSGGLVIFAFSLTGGLLSAILMSFLYFRFSKYLSIIAVSVVGAVMHNTGQIIVAAALMGGAVFAYYPILLISAVITGSLVGVLSSFIIKHLNKTGWANVKG